ncbi:hypothetical protein [Halalkalicoccus sp. NIPERK01]|nr:hypothetical protein [Halalkalicoccus sp. NIPERK01]MDL5362397.1 hypothetical protein [Halalkalicoccus sp. NIPERK01]
MVRTNDYKTLLLDGPPGGHQNDGVRGSSDRVGFLLAGARGEV